MGLVVLVKQLVLQALHSMRSHENHAMCFLIPGLIVRNDDSRPITERKPLVGGDTDRNLWLTERKIPPRRLRIMARGTVRMDPVDGCTTASPALAYAYEKPTFERIVREHGPMIKRIAASYEADAHLAEELVQEILLALWNALPTFRGDGSIGGFIARIATNRAVSHVRKAIRYGQTGELSEQMASPAITPEAEVAALDERARLIVAVRSLPLAYRQAVLLTLEGLSRDEVAGVLGISSNAVAIRISRARELLRTVMRE